MKRRRRKLPSFRELRKSVATAGCFLWIATLLVSGGCLLMGPPSEQQSERVAIWITCFVGVAVLLLCLYPRQDGPTYVHEDADDAGGSHDKS